MSDRWRWFANLSTLANGLLGVGAVLYILAGNKEWAMLLIACGIGFDGMDGIFSRRSRTPAGRFGRVADSLADAVTFGAAPAFLIAVEGSSASWQPWILAAVVLAAVYFLAAIARLTYFTARAYQRSYFLGVPTPQSALAILVTVLFHDAPAFQGVAPLGVLVGTAIVSVMMVVPVPYPKIRRDSTLRLPMLATSVAAALVLVPLQFRPPTGSSLYLLEYAAAFAFLIGVASYYLVGPFTVHRAPARTSTT